MAKAKTELEAANQEIDEAFEMDEETFNNLPAERNAGTVDWQNFASQVAGKILYFDKVMEAYTKAGGSKNCRPYLHKHLKSLEETGTVVRHYNGKKAVFKFSDNI